MWDHTQNFLLALLVLLDFLFHILDLWIGFLIRLNVGGNIERKQVLEWGIRLQVLHQGLHGMDGSITQTVPPLIDKRVLQSDRGNQLRCWGEDEL